MKTIDLRWMVKKPNQPVEEQKIEMSYEDDDNRANQELKLAQELVQGYVEVVWIGGDVKALINEEAMYNPAMAPNCGFLGNIVFFREIFDGQDAWFGSLTDDDIRKIKVWCLVHANDVHSGNVGIQVLTGKAADEYRKELNESQKRQQQEWDSF
jgi:hypothetical protein